MGFERFVRRAECMCISAFDGKTKERWVRGRTAAEVVTCILWFASDGARTPRCERDGRVKKALAER